MNLFVVAVPGDPYDARLHAEAWIRSHSNYLMELSVSRLEDLSFTPQPRPACPQRNSLLLAVNIVIYKKLISIAKAELNVENI